MSFFPDFLRGIIRNGVLTIVYPGGREESFGKQTAGWPEATVRFHSRRALFRVLRSPKLGIAEAYINGDVTVDEDRIIDLLTLYRRNTQWEKRGAVRKPSAVRRLAGSARRTLQQMNDPSKSKANAAHHYDLSNDFYRLWLDDDLQYSCAYWPDAQLREDGWPASNLSLEAAQLAKKAHIAAKLDLQPGQRVLDIGCGWGGMALYLNRVADVDVLAITLSEEQLKLARERARAAGVSDRVKFELVDYRDLAKQKSGCFDRIVSVGMFEHVGAPQFDTFFRCAANLMTDQGILLLHTIGRMGSPGKTDPFTRKYIFPGGYIPALSETVAASEPYRLIAADVENLRLHYGLTLRHWYQRAHQHRARITAMYDAKFYRLWMFYLAGAMTAFESGVMCNYQIQYIRDRRALPMTRGYLAEREAHYLQMG
jgi:cyclopropane-fatty-acyl-phospholipid synthase